MTFPIQWYSVPSEIKFQSLPDHSAARLLSPKVIYVTSFTLGAERKRELLMVQFTERLVQNHFELFTSEHQLGELI